MNTAKHTLTEQESNLFRSAIEVAVGAYQNHANKVTDYRAPAFGLDDQPADDQSHVDPVASSAAMMMISLMKVIAKDYSDAMTHDKASIGPLSFAAIDGEDDSYEVTVSYQFSRHQQTSLGYQALLAIFNANLAHPERHSPTMKLLERLL